MAAADRFDRLDALRALAMVWMTAYHLVYDLNWFRLIPPQAMLTDPVWTLQRTAIVTTFLFTAGLSQAVALAQGQGWSRFWRRWAQVAGAALLVSAGSALVFPQSFIYVGVLHGLALMLIVARLSAGWGAWLWPAGALALIAPSLAAIGLADAPALAAWLNAPGPNALGLITQKPVTEDYVPLLPWLGVVWWGLAAGQWLTARRPTILRGPVPGGAVGRRLAALGRWSLSYYLLHQPVMIGLLAAGVWLAGAR